MKAAKNAFGGGAGDGFEAWGDQDGFGKAMVHSLAMVRAETNVDTTTRTSRLTMVARNRADM